MSTNEKIPLTNSIQSDIGNSLNQNTSINANTTPASSSYSYLFIFFIIALFTGLVYFFFNQYSNYLKIDMTPTPSSDTTTATTSAFSSGSIKNQILSFLPNFQSTPTPTSTFTPITTPPVSTLSPTSIPSSNLHDHHDNVLPYYL